MALNLPSDIVLEVARAADPQAAQSATSRLMRLGGSTAAAGEDFSKIADSMPASLSDGSKAAKPWTAPQVHGQSRSAAAGAPPQVYRRFEALILQNLIELMLPQDSAGIYGKGTAGEMWKSMLAEQLGMQVAKADRSGIFSRLFASAPGGHEAKPDRLGSAAKVFGTLDGAKRSFGARG